MVMPYFMTNEKWYKEKWVGSEVNGGVEYELTDEALPEAVESFNEYNRYMDGEVIEYPNNKDFYFKKNSEWYIFDEKENMYVLTKEAPKEAIDSYLDYLGEGVTMIY